MARGYLRFSPALSRLPTEKTPTVGLPWRAAWRCGMFRKSPGGIQSAAVSRIIHQSDGRLAELAHRRSAQDA